MTLQAHLKVIVLQPLLLQELHQTAHLLLHYLILASQLQHLTLSRWLLGRFRLGCFNLRLQVLDHGLQSIAVINHRFNLLLPRVQLPPQCLNRVTRGLQLASHG